MACDNCQQELHELRVENAINETRKLKAQARARVLEEIMVELLRKIDCEDDPSDSFERQYHCGELNELLNKAFEAVGRSRTRYD